ncbi:MAG: NAD-dependent epimerase/dehydratase family protein, partial [Anaerolineae bacterium]|nr:NAD-dependent epimerase/dehydratase family protein [Anaerolineae bacterium]
MRVLITGGTGLIGARLCQLLLRDHHEIILLSRDPQAHTAHFPASVNIRRWDGRTAAGWADLLNPDTALVNLAGAYPISWLWNPSQQQDVL